MTVFSMLANAVASWETSTQSPVKYVAHRLQDILTVSIVWIYVSSPMTVGSNSRWRLLAGMIARPRTTWEQLTAEQAKITSWLWFKPSLCVCILIKNWFCTAAGFARLLDAGGVQLRKVWMGASEIRNMNGQTPPHTPPRLHTAAKLGCIPVKYSSKDSCMNCKSEILSA